MTHDHAVNRVIIGPLTRTYQPILGNTTTAYDGRGRLVSRNPYDLLYTVEKALIQQETIQHALRDIAVEGHALKVRVMCDTPAAWTLVEAAICATCHRELWPDASEPPVLQDMQPLLS